MPDDLERDLLDRFVRGDQDAFEAIFRQFQVEVYRWILRIVRDPSAAEDALVDAFWRAYRGRAGFQPSRGFGAWMRRIATNAALDHLRRSRKAARLIASGDQPRPPGPIARRSSRSFAPLPRSRPACELSRRSRSSRSGHTPRSPMPSTCQSEPSSRASFARFEY